MEYICRPNQPFIFWTCTIEVNFQGGKTFCASFCASLIAGSRRAFLWESHWLRLNEIHKLWTFPSRKAFILLCGFCFSSPENYFGIETTNVKGKTDHPVSLRSGIKSFEHSKKASILIEHSIYLWVVFAVSRWAELKPTCILLLINTFSHAQVYSLCRTSFIHLFSQTTFCAL